MSLTRKIFKYFGITVLSVAGLFILLLMLLDLAIRPQNIKNLVERFSQDYVNAEVKMDTIELHLLRNFPYASLSIKDCRIRSFAFEKLDSASRALIPLKADSLATIGSLNVSLSLVDLFSGNVNIKGVELESPEIYGYMSQFGINNWDILKLESDTTSTSDSTSLGININKIAISDGAKITLCMARDSAIVDLSLNGLLLNGLLSSEISEGYLTEAKLSQLVFMADHFHKRIIDSTLDNSLKFSIDTLDFRKKRKEDNAKVDLKIRTDLKFHGITMAKNVPLGLEGSFGLDHSVKGKLGIVLEELTLYAATLPVTLNGFIAMSENGIDFDNVKGNIDNYNIKNLLAYIPEKFLDPGSIETDAAITLRADVKGKYMFATGELPTVDFSLSIPSSSLTVADKKTNRMGTLNNIGVSVKLCFDQNNPKSNILDIERLTVQGRSLSLDVAGKIAEYTGDPVIDVKAGCHINLDTLSNMIPAGAPMVAKGAVDAKVALKGRMSTLNLFSLSRNDVDAQLTSESLKFEMPEQGIAFMSGKTSLYAGIKDSLLTQKKKMLSATLNLDTLYFSYKDSMLVSASKFSLSANQQLSNMAQKSKGKHPQPLRIDGKLSVGGLSFVDSDSTTIRLRGAENSFCIMPWTDGITPVFAFNAAYRGMGFIVSGSRFFARDSKFAVNVIAHAPKEIDRPRPDSSAMQAPNTRRFIRNVLKYWELKGNVSSASGRVITPYFPLRTRFSNLDLSISNDGIHFQDAKFDVGNSSITLSGKLQGFAKAVTEHQKIFFAGSVASDSLDVNQIMQAFSNTKDVSMADDRSDDAVENAMQTAMENDTSAMKAPLVPDFLEADINLDLNNVKYKNNLLKALRGNFVVNNGIFQMNQFEIATKTGAIDLFAFYAAKTRDDISLGFGMEMNQFEVADIIAFIPNIDSLLPMLRSFSGKLTCNLSGMSKMDSLLNIKLETLNGVLSIDGENVVLMDGETFAEIAKMLKFKNRDKNLINRISAQCVVADNKIEIFPFVIQMDRYQAAVSGTQNLDLSFKYHISVLHSPIPFRIGLNITGTPDDMHFRIGKCLYKNENVPVYTAVLDSARVNLGEQIKGVFRNGVESTLDNGSTAKLAQTAEEEQKKTSGMGELSQNEQQQLSATQ